MEFELESKLVIKAFYNVYNKLSFGFLEKVYENSMMVELSKLGLSARRQVPIKVSYDDSIVGEYFADILINNKLILELKAESGICKEYEAQLINYLKATEIEIGLLLNFGQTPQFKRKIFSNEYKTNS